MSSTQMPVSAYAQYRRRDLRAGDRFGQFNILQRIGSGGSGFVYKASHPAVDCPVALKIGINGEHRFLRYFETESMVLNKLSESPEEERDYFPPIFQSGIEDGLPYVATKYIDGICLDSLISLNRQIPLYQALDLLMQICYGLNILHNIGYVHRDIKPENIIVADNNKAVIIDYNLSVLSPLPQSEKTFGTIGFMSPEQIRGGIIDRRSDIFSLGIVFYNMLTGRHPFISSISFRDLDSAYQNDGIHYIKTMNSWPPISAGAPLWVREIFNLMTARKPEDRYPDCGRIIDEIQKHPEDLANK